MSGEIITTTRTDYLARIEAGERGRFCIGSDRSESTLAGSVKTPGHVLDAAAGLPVSVPFHGGSYA